MDLEGNLTAEEAVYLLVGEESWVETGLAAQLVHPDMDKVERPVSRFGRA